MAHTLTKQKKASAAVLTPIQMKVAEALANGTTVAEIAKKLSGGDKKKASRWRATIRSWAGTPAFSKAVFDMHRAEGILGLGPAIAGMNARAARGRIDAVKLLMSFTGIHNEKVSHEHSGDIQINVSIPRPAKPSEATGIGPGKDEESYVDAEVVDD